MKKHICEILTLLVCISCSQSPTNDYEADAWRRADSLVNLLTLEEKAQLTMDYSRSVERLGIKQYNWWNEALHGVARAGLATVFPQPIGMAASFDTDAVYNVYTAVSDEARAKNAQFVREGTRERYQGLTMWTPTVNIFRDPRWGRGIETYGEDPYLTSRMGVMVVKGLQGPAGQPYDKLHACAKHFAVHSGPEWNRHTYNAENIEPRDLWETYLPPFKALVQEANVEEVMCAYNRFEGQPCCGSDKLLLDILRDEWGYDGIVVADCGAIADFYRENAHRTHPSAVEASADAVAHGTDLDCGSSYKAIVKSVEQGLLDEAKLDESVRRLLKARFRLGEMDDPAQVEWTRIPYSVVASDKHDSIALDIARKSMTLLVNKNGTLPLKRGGLTVAVMGPNANDSVMQWGNYNGTPRHTVTLLEGVRAKLTDSDRLIYEPGCAHVERTLVRSIFDQCMSEGKPGFTARYWNNTRREGDPVNVVQVTTPPQYCAAGATVFAPGVNLTDFSATYSTTFVPKEDGEYHLDIYAYGTGRIRVNGKEVKGYSNKHGARKSTYKLKARRGQRYDIEIDYEFLRADALLSFDLGIKEEINIERSVRRVKDADVVIFAGGLSPMLEGEEMGVHLPGFRGGDRTEIELPAVQRELVAALHEAGKRVVFVNFSGSPVALIPEVEHSVAVLQAWYPGQAGGRAAADVLFGDYNPAGRLPVTFYSSLAQLPDFEDYNMKGRTYRYMIEAPLFPFGYGLSYTTFAYGEPRLSRKSFSEGKTLTVTVPVTNIGAMDGDEVVQLYMRRVDDANGPVKALRAFRRVHVTAGATEQVALTLTDREMEWWNPETNTLCIYPGEYELFIGGSSRNEDLQTFNLMVK